MLLVKSNVPSCCFCGFKSTIRYPSLTNWRAILGLNTILVFMFINPLMYISGIQIAKSGILIPKILKNRHLQNSNFAYFLRLFPTFAPYIPINNLLLFTTCLNLLTSHICPLTLRKIFSNPCINFCTTTEDIRV